MPIDEAPLHLMGWSDVPERHDVAATMPTLSQAAPHLMGSSRGDVFTFRAMKDVLRSYISYPAQGIGDCFPAGTMVFGERTRPIEQVAVGDRVWTGEGRLTEVISTRSLTTNRPMVRIRPVGGLPITCTADHRFLVYQFDRVSGRRVTPNRYRAATEGGMTRESDRAVAAVYESREPVWVAAGELTDSDCLLTPTAYDPIERPISPGGLLDTEDGRFAIGYFLGNGHASGGSAEWTLPLGSPVAARLMAIMGSHGFSPKLERYRDREAERVRVHSRELVEWLRLNFYDEKSKSFPGWLVGDRPALDGLMAADGWGSGPERTFDSTSLSLIQGVHATLLALGESPIVTKFSRSKTGSYANAKPMYRVVCVSGKKRQDTWRDERFFCRPVRSVEFIEGPATVYDIGVKDEHHSFLADGVAVHNCAGVNPTHALDMTQCTDIVLNKGSQDFEALASEVSYGLSREIAGLLGTRSDGTYGAATAKAFTTVGTVPRKVTGDYDARKAKAYGTNGVPAELKAEAAKHKLANAALVTTLDELDAAIDNGYVGSVCSNQGFTMIRDQNGVCQPSGSWAHCMQMGLGRKTVNGKVYYGIGQSWGDDQPSGPIADGAPPWFFWIPETAMARMVSAGDSFVYSGYQGFNLRPLPSAWTHLGWFI